MKYQFKAMPVEQMEILEFLRLKNEGKDVCEHSDVLKALCEDGWELEFGLPKINSGGVIHKGVYFLKKPDI